AGIKAAETSGELAERFADAANGGVLETQEGLSVPDCWQKECGSVAEQARQKFKVKLGRDLQTLYGRAVFDADIVCEEDRKCDEVHLLVGMAGGGHWLVYDITENDRKATEW